ncbi:UNVERIFIED_CONTAM: NAD(P)-dependent oxidoreductase, partial [Prevotella sp. 15_C9]
LMGDCFGKKAPVNSQKLSKITESLTFSNEKAVRELGWRPISVLENFKIG